MAYIFNFLTEESIEIDESFFLRFDYNYITIEFPRGFDWLNHTRECKECNSFLMDIQNRTSQWFLSIENSVWMIDLSNEFRNKENHYANHLSTETIDGLTQRWLKLKISTASIEKIEEKLLNELNKENYEKCAELRDVLIKMKNNENV